MGVTTGKGVRMRDTSSSPCPVLWPSGKWHVVSVCFKRQREPTTPTEALPDARRRGGPTWVRAIVKPLRVRAPGFEPLFYISSEKKRSGHK